MPRIAQHPPRHRHLGHVEIPVGQRNQHTHRTIIAQRRPRANLCLTGALFCRQ
jgi:hypothetical protein